MLSAPLSILFICNTQWKCMKGLTPCPPPRCKCKSCKAAYLTFVPDLQVLSHKIISEKELRRELCWARFLKVSTYVSGSGPPCIHGNTCRCTRSGRLGMFHHFCKGYFGKTLALKEEVTYPSINQNQTETLGRCGITCLWRSQVSESRINK